MSKSAVCALLCLLAALSGCASEPEGAEEGAQAEAGPPRAPATPEGVLAERFAERGARRFRIRYRTTLRGLSPGARVRLWIPLPRDDAFQHVSELEVESPWDYRETSSPPEANRTLYAEGRASGAEAEVLVSYTVQRLERRADLGAETSATPAGFAARHLEPSSFVRVSEELQAEHARVVSRGSAPLARARAFYEHVRAQMSYDKSGEGWGRGDSRYACTVGRGNCTDFHAYFQALCLIERIPTRFSIGLYGPYEPAPEGVEQALGGYHCWAEFYAPGPGWVPVDISEADKDPARADYFFGSHSDNRVTLSRGRDLVLSPAQAGPPLNFFVEPYAEVEGQPFAGASKRATWTDFPR